MDSALAVGPAYSSIRVYSHQYGDLILREREKMPGEMLLGINVSDKCNLHSTAETSFKWSSLC